MPTSAYVLVIFRMTPCVRQRWGGEARGVLKRAQLEPSKFSRR